MTVRKVTKEGDQIVIHIPLKDVHGLRVALVECSCKAPKSNATVSVRESLRRALAKAEALG